MPFVHFNSHRNICSASFYGSHRSKLSISTRNSLAKAPTSSILTKTLLLARIFVTGGTGFIGSYFINLAIEEGHQIVALRRPDSTPRFPVRDCGVLQESDLFPWQPANLNVNTGRHSA